MPVSRFPVLRHTGCSMDNPHEMELLDAARSFDMHALADIYDAYSPALYAYAARMLGSPAEAEECVSETFSRFLQALQKGNGPRHYLRAYLYRMAHNWITDQYRRQPPPPLELDESLMDGNLPKPGQVAEQRDVQNRLRNALKALTPDQRQVLVLKYLEEMENEEVAAALGKPVGAVKALQHRALAALRRLLPEEEFV